MMVDRFASLFRADDGATAIVVAITLMLLFGAALIAVDTGSVWASRRQVITGTDSAALGAAGYFAEVSSAACSAPGRSAAMSRARDFVSSNAPGAVVTSFTLDSVDCLTNSGIVNVEAEASSSGIFAPIFGFGDVKASSRSTAQWGSIIALQGARPLAICDREPAVREWVTLGGTTAYSNLRGVDYLFTDHYDHPGASSYPAAGVVHRIPTSGMSPCQGNIDARVGWLDFNGSKPPNGINGLRHWLLNGLEDTMTLGTRAYGDEDCQPSVPGNNKCEGRRSGGTSLESTLDQISCPRTTPTAECQMFPVILYDEASDRGSWYEFRPSGYLGLVLRGFDGIGKGAKDDDDDDDDDDKDKDKGKGKDKSSSGEGYLDLEFVSVQWEGVIGSHGVNAGVYGVQICGVDNDAADRCDVRTR